MSSPYLKYFLDIEIFEIIRSGLLLIDYFCLNSEKAGKYFPVGMGRKPFETIVVDDINKIMNPIYKGQELDF
jgi:hypothetical protein